jgi:hypothetical protein
MSIVQHYTHLEIVKFLEIERDGDVRRFHVTGALGSKVPILQDFHAGTNPPPPDPKDIEELNRQAEETYKLEGEYGYIRVICWRYGTVYDEKNAAKVVPEVVEEMVLEHVKNNP